ncbi:MAG: DUF1287 domain-containing protein [Ignavibacteria bacterium]
MCTLFFITFQFLFFLTGCNSNNNTQGNNGSEKSDSLHSESFSKEIQLTEAQQNIVNGARKNLSEETEYDLTMGYYVLTYRDGEDTGNKTFPDGDLDPEIGVCTDVIVRALRYGGITDLQKELNEDIISNRSDYPFSRWGNKKADSNIDHRRVMNLEVWFSKYWKTVDEDTDESFLPGDLVVWDMNQDGASDHIGIVSDTFTGERFKVIHNHPDPGHIADEDKIFLWEISGHYRIRN